ncbi:MAG TPA: hypothetical protein VMB18_19920 [Terriglobales bacterium]|jgi:hypothetical protein|nr:hypothetical protein [Terriglobales bacterium]
MKRFVLFTFVLSCLCLPTAMRAQNSEDHVEIGAFADYLRFYAPPTPINFVGLGGRVGFNVRSNIQLEAEMSYDFRRDFTSTFSNGVSTELVRTHLRPLTGLFGPKFETSGGAVRAFVTGKAGFINFSATNSGALPGFTDAVGGITTGVTKFAIYPGGGIEGFLGPIGLRLEVGDEIYFAGGAQNNLRVTFGPTFRF